MNNPEEHRVAISIRRIKDISFFINESLFVDDPSKFLKIEVQQQLNYSFETNIVSLTLRVYYHYENSSPLENIVDIQVQNVFEISDLKNYRVNESELKLPPDIIIMILSLSISHSRALLTKNMAGTTVQDQIMTVINPVDLAKTFYPRMFEQIEKDNPTKSDSKKKGGTKTGKRVSKNSY